tara:strand:- start:299 stop:430 length:132 start_codon:yes stop_codon:yes gene_type:complete
MFEQNLEEWARPPKKMEKIYGFTLSASVFSSDIARALHSRYPF